LSCDVQSRGIAMPRLFSSPASGGEGVGTGCVRPRDGGEIFITICPLCCVGTSGSPGAPGTITAFCRQLARGLPRLQTTHTATSFAVGLALVDC
jgi:hypothetical protein